MSISLSELDNKLNALEEEMKAQFLAQKIVCRALLQKNNIDPKVFNTDFDFIDELSEYNSDGSKPQQKIIEMRKRIFIRTEEILKFMGSG